MSPGFAARAQGRKGTPTPVQLRNRCNCLGAGASCQVGLRSTSGGGSTAESLPRGVPMRSCLGCPGAVG